MRYTINFVHFYLVISDDGSSEAQTSGKNGWLVRKARKKKKNFARLAERRADSSVTKPFYGDWGFHCDPEDYFMLAPHFVAFEHRQGNASDSWGNGVLFS